MTPDQREEVLEGWEDEWKEDTEGMLTDVGETVISVQVFTYKGKEKTHLKVTSYNQLDCKLNKVFMMIVEPHVPKWTRMWLEKMELNVLWKQV